MGLLTIALIGLLVLLVIAAGIVYWLWKNQRGIVRARKRLAGGKSVLEIVANTDLDEVQVQDQAGKERVLFARTGLRAGERVEFRYPASVRKAVVTACADKEKETIEVEPA